MELPTDTQQFSGRLVAAKIAIQELLEGTYVQEQDLRPNYLLTLDNRKIYRLNVMATVVRKELRGNTFNLYVDDGTGNIVVRFFETGDAVNTPNVGDTVFIVGKMRTFAQEKYISPEIVKKISPLWLKVRSLELARLHPAPEIQEEVVAVRPKDQETVHHGIAEEHEELLPRQKIIQLIQKSDRGEGVAIEDVLEQSPFENTNIILEKMIAAGEIFQLRPGRVRIL